MTSDQRSEHAPLLRDALASDFLVATRAGGSTPRGRSLSCRLEAALTVEHCADEAAAYVHDINWRLRNCVSAANILMIVDDALRREGPALADATDLVLRNYWAEFDGWLMPPTIARAITAEIDAKDPAIAASMEGTLTRFSGAISYCKAKSIHESAARRWKAGPHLPETIRAGLLLTDYLLLQQVIAIDVRRASRIAGRLESVGSLLTRMETAGSLLSNAVATKLILG